MKDSPALTAEQQARLAGVRQAIAHVQAVLTAEQWTKVPERIRTPRGRGAGGPGGAGRGFEGGGGGRRPF